jgi:uncharacterized caspase-like protein
VSRKRALLIGNGKYDAGLPPLAKPDADIEALARVLREPTIGGFDEVTPLLDLENGRVRREIDHFFGSCVKDDLLLLYFSGHGLRSEWGDLYLAVRDTEPKHLVGTAIPAADITLQMDRCRSRRQILILDCCYSGAFERGAKGSATSPAIAFEGNGLGRVVLTASDSTQLAWEDSGDGTAGSDSETSVFTRHLIHGLESGEADRDADGLVTVDDLYDYVYEHVVTENPRQTPGKWSYKQQGEIVLARNPAWVPRLPAELQQAPQGAPVKRVPPPKLVTERAPARALQNEETRTAPPEPVQAGSGSRKSRWGLWLTLGGGLLLLLFFVLLVTGLGPKGTSILNGCQLEDKTPVGATALRRHPPPPARVLTRLLAASIGATKRSKATPTSTARWSLKMDWGCRSGSLANSCRSAAETTAQGPRVAISSAIAWRRLWFLSRRPRFPMA